MSVHRKVESERGDGGLSRMWGGGGVVPELRGTKTEY